MSHGSHGTGTSVHGLQKLTPGAGDIHPTSCSHCTPSSSTYVEGNQPTCRGSGEVSRGLGSSRDLLSCCWDYSSATMCCSQ